jgi:hypothetical protein
MRRWAPLLDLICILVFVAIGRSAHDHGVNVGGMVSTTWPFAVGGVVAWSVAWRRHLDVMSPWPAFLIVVITVALGMILRVVSGQGTALAFIIVALAFLTLFVVGWRLCVRLLVRQRSTRQ